MRTIVFAALFSGALFIVGCKTKDPVASYTQFAETVAENLEEKYPAFTVSVDDDLDVQETDSLKNPVVGESNYRITATFEGEEQGVELKIKVTLKHALQDEKWNLIEGGSLDMWSAEALYGGDEILDKMLNDQLAASRRQRAIGGMPVDSQLGLDTLLDVYFTFWKDL